MPNAYLCTVSRKTPENWNLCKQAGLWGVTSASRGISRVSAGDRLYVWVGGTGFVAEAVVTGPARRPLDDAEVPWPGGISRYSYLLPFELARELRAPLFLRFDEHQQQSETGLYQGNFQKSIAPLSTRVAERLAALFASAAQDADAS